MNQEAEKPIIRSGFPLRRKFAQLMLWNLLCAPLSFGENNSLPSPLSAHPAKIANPTLYSQTLRFSGYTWDVKSGNNRGPGNNNWSDSPDDVWVDESGYLHLRIVTRNGLWYSTKVISQDFFGFGHYYFFLKTRVDQLDPNVVLGLFTYMDQDHDGLIKPEQGDGEIDIEFTRWGDSQANFNTIYAIQPIPSDKSTRERFFTSLNGSYSTHSFYWLSNQVQFMSVHGLYKTPPAQNFIIHQTTIAHPNVPTNNKTQVHINFWIDTKYPASSPLEVVITRFTYEPALSPMPTPTPTTGLWNWRIID